VVCDLDGVVYLLGQPIPGAGRALLDMAGAGYSILFVTNNSTRPPDATASRIADLTGYPARPRQVIGSAAAAVTLLTAGAGPVLVVGGAGIRTALNEAGFAETDDPHEAEAVIVGLDTNISYGRLRDAVLAVRNGARFIATNTDPTYPTPDGLWPGAGAMVAAIEVGAGIQPEIAGKPHPPIRRLIHERLQPGPVWVVGDRPETDLAMARAEGWTAVLVLTGVIGAAAELTDEHRPDLVLRSLAELPQALQA
jgi:4-nitrophenyl phosphatase